MKKVRCKWTIRTESGQPENGKSGLNPMVIPKRHDPGFDLRKVLKTAIFLAVFILTSIHIAIAQPIKTVPRALIQRKAPVKALKIKTFTYNGKQGCCERLPSQASQEGSVETAPPPRLPSLLLSDLTVLGVKHMLVTHSGKEYVRVVAKIANISDQPMRREKFRVFFKIGGETHACLAVLPRLDAHRMANLSREVELRRGLDYRVTVIVDFLNTEQEANENNNEFIYTIHVK